MTDKEQQLEHLREAVDRKAEAAREAAESHPPTPGESGGGASRSQRSLEEPGRTQDVASARQKSSGHGKKTADKWNQ